MGSFAHLGRWARDPLVALGCQDPVARIGEAKAWDTGRQQTVELFAARWEHHHDLPVKATDLHPAAKEILDPQNRGRQFLAAQVQRLVGTRIAGKVLQRSKSDATWSTATYALKQAGG